MRDVQVCEGEGHRVERLELRSGVFFGIFLALALAGEARESNAISFG